MTLYEEKMYLIDRIKELEEQTKRFKKEYESGKITKEEYQDLVQYHNCLISEMDYQIETISILW